jgi:hypothetical protein
MPCIANATTKPDKHVETEITDEMIEAGVYALLDFNHDYESEEDAVIRIWSAMKSVAPPPRISAQRRRRRAESAGEQ